VREAEEVKRLRCALATPLPSCCRVAAKLDQSRLLRVQFQGALLEAFPPCSPEPVGVVPMFAADDKVVGCPHDDDLSPCIPPPPPVGPEV
jgi:hypothetical protein